MAREPDGGPNTLDVQVGLNLRRLRKRRKLSQEQLAKSLGITFQQIQKYERGTNRISASMLIMAARSLEVNAADLLPDDDAPPLPRSAELLTSLRGGEEVLQAYAAIKSTALRRAVLKLMKDVAGSQNDHAATVLDPAELATGPMG